MQPIEKEVDVPVVPFATCQTTLRTTRLGVAFNLDPSFLCAGGEPGKDACTVRERYNVFLIFEGESRYTESINS